MKTVERQRSGGSNPSSSASKPAQRWLFASSEGFGRYAPFLFFPLDASRRSPRGHATYASLRSVPPLLRFLRNLADVPARRLMPPSALRASNSPTQAGRDVAEGEIPEEEGLFRVIEIDPLILNQIRLWLPVFHSGFPARRPLQYVSFDGRYRRFGCQEAGFSPGER